MYHLTLNELTADQIVAVGLALGGTSAGLSADDFIEKVAGKVVRVVRTEDSYPAIESEGDEDGDEKIVSLREQKEPEAPAATVKKRRNRAEMEAARKAEATTEDKPATSRRAARDEEQAEPETPRRRADPAPNLVKQLGDLASEFIDLYTTEAGGEAELRKLLKRFGVETIADVAPSDRMAVMADIRAKIAEE